MGRRKKPIDFNSPAGRFAADLRNARIEADLPTYREMSRRASWSHTGLSQADRGHRLPTWDCTQAYLRGLGITDDAQLTGWRQKWLSATREINRAAEQRSKDAEQSMTGVG